MQTFRMLVLTDHAAHSAENSIYALVQDLRKNPRCRYIDVASRSVSRNALFFHHFSQRSLYVARADEGFSFRPDGHFFKNKLRLVSLREYDVILIRLPHPVPEQFWQFLASIYPEKQIINNPAGIHETSSKHFLLQVADLCPPIQLCKSVEDILAFKARFPIVLKPPRNYGGKGIVRVENEQAWEGNRRMPLQRFLKAYQTAPVEYLGMQFLPGVAQGDKRIVVVDGQVLGASIRMPAKGSWMCNVAQGGFATPAEADDDELRIAARLAPVLREKGVIVFGFDTLMGNEGRRTLSEINTLSIGGLPQIANFTGRPVVREAADLIWEYVKQVIYGRSPAAA